MKGAYREFKKFFSTGVFYIVLGGIFLFVSYWQIGEPGSHPSFIFFLAILGAAIVLYGTGTQAAGKSSTGTINVAIAGGAGVLAIVLGFGVVKFNEDIQKVFSSADYYAVIQLEPESRNANLKDFIIGARLPNSQPLHLWKSDHEVQILVPVATTDKMTELTVVVQKRNTNDRSQSDLTQRYEIVWSEKSFKSSKPGAQSPTEGKISSSSESGHNVRFQLNDVLVVTLAEDVVEPLAEDGVEPGEDERPIRVLPQ